jgi:hypothetical protein
VCRIRGAFAVALRLALWCGSSRPFSCVRCAVLCAPVHSCPVRGACEANASVRRRPKPPLSHVALAQNSEAAAAAELPLILNFPGGGKFFYWQSGVATYLNRHFDLSQIKLVGASAVRACVCVCVSPSTLHGLDAVRPSCLPWGPEVRRLTRVRTMSIWRVSPRQCRGA